VGVGGGGGGLMVGFWLRPSGEGEGKGLCWVSPKKNQNGVVASKGCMSKELGRDLTGNLWV